VGVEVAGSDPAALFQQVNTMLQLYE
jgi:hypothetical protein